MNTAVLAGAQERAGNHVTGKRRTTEALSVTNPSRPCQRTLPPQHCFRTHRGPVSRLQGIVAENRVQTKDFRPYNTPVVKRLPGILALLALLATVPAFPQPSANDQSLPFGNILKNKLLILRGFYGSEKLEFDADGRALPDARLGFGPTDGTFHVISIHYPPGKVVLEGDLPLLNYHLDTNSVSYAEGIVKRSVTIDVPDSTDQNAVEHALWSVFYRPGKSITPSCTAEEKADFAAHMRRERERQGKKPKQQAESSGPIPPSGICFPLGEHVLHHVGKTEGVSAPISIHTPDPSFPDNAPKGVFDDTVNVAAIIDESGRVTTMTVVKSLGLSFDQVAVAKIRTWTMQPALMNGKPVAVSVTIEMRFSRH